LAVRGPAPQQADAGVTLPERQRDHPILDRVLASAIRSSATCGHNARPPCSRACQQAETGQHVSHNLFLSLSERVESQRPGE
jgi:hypothetical protein